MCVSVKGRGGSVRFVGRGSSYDVPRKRIYRGTLRHTLKGSVCVWAVGPHLQCPSVIRLLIKLIYPYVTRVVPIRYVVYVVLAKDTWVYGESVDKICSVCCTLQGYMGVRTVVHCTDSCEA